MLGVIAPVLPCGDFILDGAFQWAHAAVGLGAVIERVSAQVHLGLVCAVPQAGWIDIVCADGKHCQEVIGDHLQTQRKPREPCLHWCLAFGGDVADIMMSGLSCCCYGCQGQVARLLMTLTFSHLHHNFSAST